MAFFRARHLSSHLQRNMSVQRLVRFVSKEDGKTYYGDASETLRTARPLKASSPFSSTTQASSDEHTISKLLCPLELSDCPSIVCVGLNYTDHAEEAKMAIPKNPVIL